MIRSQPGLLSLSLKGDVLQKIEFFVEEMGLGSDQVAKIVCSHPQASITTLTTTVL